jgi:hypothetical protein
VTARRPPRARALLVLGASVALAAVGLGATPATAADVVPKDPAIGGTFYLANGNDGTDSPVGASVGWNDPVIALPKAGDLTNPLVAPPGTEAVVTFVGPQGRESDPASWNATAPWPYTAPGQLMADVTPYHLISPGAGTPSGTNATATVSGDYSLGVAFLNDGGQHVVAGGLYFVHIHLTGNADPHKATYTWQPIDPSGPPVAGGGTSAGGSAAAPAGMLAFTAGPGSSGNPLGTLAVDGGANQAWTVTVSSSGGARTLVTGAGAHTIVDTSAAGAPATSGNRITLTVVGS